MLGPIGFEESGALPWLRLIGKPLAYFRWARFSKASVHKSSTRMKGFGPC